MKPESPQGYKDKKKKTFTGHMKTGTRHQPVQGVYEISSLPSGTSKATFVLRGEKTANFAKVMIEYEKGKHQTNKTYVRLFLLRWHGFGDQCRRG